MTLNEFIQVLMGFIGSAGFAILLNIRGKKMIFASIGGLLSWLMFVLLSKIIPSEPVCYLIVSILISIYAEVLARTLKTPTTSFIIISLIPLIPGSSLYYTMANAFAGDMENFLNKGIKTIELAAALALGIILVSAVADFIIKIKTPRRK